MAIDPADPLLLELLAALVDAEDALNFKLKSTLRPGSGAAAQSASSSSGAAVAGSATGTCGPACTATGGSGGVGISLPSVRRVLALWGIGGGDGGASAPAGGP